MSENENEGRPQKEHSRINTVACLLGNATVISEFRIW
jgi:hypothetical protein